MTQRTIRDWQRDVHALAVSKGWYDCARCGDAPGRFDCCLCNGTGRVDTTDPVWIASRLERIHAEISEAGECVARGEMMLDWAAGADGTRFLDSGDRNMRLLAARQGCKPEGFPVELADVFLRLMDFEFACLTERGRDDIAEQQLSSHGFGLNNATPVRIAAALGFLHAFLGDCMGFVHREDEDHNNDHPCMHALWQVHCQLFAIAHACGVDLLAMAELKHAYNATRPYRHGGKRI